MRYRLTVADRETGRDSKLEIECATAAEAERRANAAGFLVSCVELLADKPAHSASRHNAAQLPATVTSTGHQVLNKTTSANIPSPLEAPAAIAFLLVLVLGGYLG